MRLLSVLLILPLLGLCATPAFSAWVLISSADDPVHEGSQIDVTGGEFQPGSELLKVYAEFYINSNWAVAIEQDKSGLTLDYNTGALTGMIASLDVDGGNVGTLVRLRVETGWVGHQYTWWSNELPFQYLGVIVPALSTGGALLLSGLLAARMVGRRRKKS